MSVLSGVEEALKSIEPYSSQLKLNLNLKGDRFKWFMASMLFAKRISSKIALKTFRVFVERGLTSPEAILSVGWDGLVEALDAGGYVRYDFSTATNMIENMKLLIDRYGGDIDVIHESAIDSRDLERRLMEFKGFGPTAVNIFLRELRGIWVKANPEVSKYAINVASKIGLNSDLTLKYESQLVKVFIEYCKGGLCSKCPLSKYCHNRAG